MKKRNRGDSGGRGEGGRSKRVNKASPYLVKEMVMESVSAYHLGKAGGKEVTGRAKTLEREEREGRSRRLEGQLNKMEKTVSD